MIHGQKRRSILIAVLLIISYGLWRFFTARFHALRPSLPHPQTRTPFPVDFALPDVTGNIVRLADFYGQPILVNFWATWCAPCRREMPSMQALYDAFHLQGMGFVAIASDANGAAAVEPFMQEYRLRFPLLLDPQNTIGEQLHILGLPTTYLLDRQGRIAAYEVGAREWNSPAWQQLVTRLLAETPGG